MLQVLPGSISTYGSIFRMIEGAETLKMDIKTVACGFGPIYTISELRRKGKRSLFASIEYNSR